MRYRRLLEGLTSLVAMSSGFSCLPADTRPEPAQVNWWASLASSRETITTEDGWTIAIDRLLVGLGNARPSDACIDYSDSRYDRLLDLTRSGDQKLSTFFALGKCAVNYRMSGPSSETVLGAGVSESDKRQLGMYVADAFVTGGAPVALDLLATATRGETTERLHWSFRRTVRYLDCGLGAEGAAAMPFDFQTGTMREFHIDVHPEILFQGGGSTGKLRFDPIAAADVSTGDADGWVTLEELRQTPLDVPLSDHGVGGPEPTEIVTLEDLIYLVLVPLVPQFREPVGCSNRPASWQFD